MLVLMGSGAETARETVDRAQRARASGSASCRCGCTGRSRPTALLAALPAERAHGRRARPHEGARLDGRAALPRRRRRARRGRRRRRLPTAVDRRPLRALVQGVHARHGRRRASPSSRSERPQRRFTVGIDDDVCGTSLALRRRRSTSSRPRRVRAVFFGLGSDGTVGANKNTIKILGAEEGLHAQGYFVYDSKKSGSQTVSHLRFGPQPIRAPYLVQRRELRRLPPVRPARPRRRARPRGARARRCCSTARSRRTRSGTRCRARCRSRSSPSGIALYAIDAGRVAREAGMRRPHQHRAADLLLRDLRRAAARRGDRADQARDREDLRPPRRRGRAPQPRRGRRARSTRLHQVDGARRVTATREPRPRRAGRRARVRAHRHRRDARRAAATSCRSARCRSTAPTRAAPPPTRSATSPSSSPVWDPDLCIQCGNCSLRLPAQRDPLALLRRRRSSTARPTASSRRRSTRVGLPDTRYTLEVYVEDCTGCGLCVEACPVDGARTTEPQGDQPRDARAARRRRRARASRSSRRCRVNDRARVDFGDACAAPSSCEPLFEFSGACAGCGETPYLKLLSQLFGDRLMVANATGCSSIYGGNLPTTPWTTDADGRGPAWSNSLFEDNAEFGLGFRLAADRHARARAPPRSTELRDAIGAELVDEILDAPQLRESELRAQRGRVAELTRRLDGARRPRRGRPAQRRRPPRPPQRLDRRRRRLGLRHRLGRARPRARQRPQRQRARARHRGLLEHRRPDVEGDAARRGRQVRRRRARHVPKKDLALQAIAYGNVYVARVAMGADPQQTLTRAARGRGLRRPLARARLQPLHRARHRHARRARPAAPRRARAATGR